VRGAGARRLHGDSGVGGGRAGDLQAFAAVDVDELVGRPAQPIPCRVLIQAPDLNERVKSWQRKCGGPRVDAHRVLVDEVRRAGPGCTARASGARQARLIDPGRVGGRVGGGQALAARRSAVRPGPENAAMITPSG
jgi:hypothetical protein